MFEYKPGVSHKVSAETAGAEIMRIAEKYNGATAEDVVKESMPKKAPLHPEFTWNDKLAAHEHRKEEARKLMRDLIPIETAEPAERNEPSGVRSLEVTTHEGRRAYRPIEQIMSDPDQRAQLLDRALAEMRAFRNRYQHIRELAEVFSAMDKVEA